MWWFDWKSRHYGNVLSVVPRDHCDVKYQVFMCALLLMCMHGNALMCTILCQHVQYSALVLRLYSTLIYLDKISNILEPHPQRFWFGSAGVGHGRLLFTPRVILMQVVCADHILRNNGVVVWSGLWSQAATDWFSSRLKPRVNFCLLICEKRNNYGTCFRGSCED